MEENNKSLGFKICGGIMMAQGMTCFIISYISPRYDVGKYLDPIFALYMLNLMCFGMVNLFVGNFIMELGFGRYMPVEQRGIHFKIIIGIFAALWFLEWLSVSGYLKPLGIIEYIFYMVILIKIFFHHKRCRLLEEQFKKT